MGFGQVLQKFITSWYEKRFTVLAINGHVTAPFAVYRGVQQHDPTFPFLFIIQMISLCDMIESARSAYGIRLSPTITLPTGSYFADDSLLLDHPPSAAVSLYGIADAYWWGSRAILHLGKCVAVPEKSTDTQVIPNGISALPTGQAIVILGIPMGYNISHEQCIQTVVKRMRDRCDQIENRTRKIQR